MWKYKLFAVIAALFMTGEVAMDLMRQIVDLIMRFYDIDSSEIFIN